MWKKRFAALSIVVILAIIVIAIVSNMNAPDKSGRFHNILWGASQTDVAKIFPEGVSSEDSETNETKYTVTIEDYTNIEGISAIATFRFGDSGLNNVLLIILTDDNLPYYKAVQQLKHYYAELHGDAVSSTFSTNLWEAADGQIELWSYESLITVTYEPKE